MRALLLVVLVLFVLGCGKDDPKPQIVHTAIDGSWTYTTPDNYLKVTFDLTRISDMELAISNTQIFISDVEGSAAGDVADVNLPSIDWLRINANDAALQYGYFILFTNCSVSGDFSRITATDAEYTISKSKTKKLSSVVIVRAPE